jgi:hypothetical protein
VSGDVAGVSAGRGGRAQSGTVKATQLGVTAVAIDIAELQVGVTMARAHVAGRRHRTGKCHSGD